MTLKQAIISFFYSIGQITLGLLVHPYQTVQSLMREKVFSWMVFLPVLVYVLAKVVWFWIVVPLVQLVFSCQTSTFIGCESISFFANWLTLFCIYWQVMLLYLAVRFSVAFSSDD